MVLTSASLLPLLAGTPEQSKIWASELIVINRTSGKVPGTADSRLAAALLVTLWADVLPDTSPKYPVLR